MHSNDTVNTRTSAPINYWFAIAWRLFTREFGRGELTIIGLSIVLAVSSVMALSSVTDRVDKAIMSKSAAFLAADRDLSSAHPMGDQFITKATELNLATDQHIYFSSMAFAGDQMNIAVIKAVSPTYPLRGQLFVTTDLSTNNKIEKHGPKTGEAWLTKRLFYALNLDPAALKNMSSTLKVDVGELTLQVTGVIDAEPDAPFEVFSSGTRIIMNIEDVPATKVIQPGSRISYVNLFAGDEADLSDFDVWIKDNLKENQRFRNVKEGASNITASLERAESFLMLAGVLGVLLAATAVAVATKLYSQRHLDSIAIVKTLGASLNQVKVIYLFQLVLIAVSSVAIGIIFGAIMQQGAVSAMAAYLPDELPSIGLKPVIMAMITGLVCAFMFSIPSLLKLFSVPPLRVLRRNLGDDIATSISARILMALTTILLVWIYSQNIQITLIIGVAGIILVVLILVFTRLMLYFSRKIGNSVGGSAVKIALASLKRRVKENAAQMIGFTLAIMLILILYSLENSIIQEWQEQLPEGTPNHFVINIAQHELDDVKQELSNQGLEPEQYYPIIRGRLTHINDEKLVQKKQEETGSKLRDGSETENNTQQAQAATESIPKSQNSGSGEQTENEESEQKQRNGIGRELNLTFSDEMAKNNVLLSGEWMPEGKGPQVSVEEGVAERMQIKLGDNLTFLIGAREVSAQVTSIREVDWNSFQPNFFMIFSHDVLSDFPATFITSFYLPTEKKLWLNDLLHDYPTLSVIDVEAMLNQIQQTIAQVAVAIRIVLIVVVFAATLVLLAQVQSSLDERRRETVIFRTLGAKGSLIQSAIIIEFLSLGAIAGIIAATVADFSLFLLQWRIFEMSWSLHWELCLIGPAIGAGFVATVGALSTRSLMKMSPNELIRHLS
ncbi:cell division protein FtsX [Psychrosphaera sp. 1_MG-2023]|uniref:ABC transporter permease n=1 Tax=Psychrosphaera sp. 1_MG-2023 TaxID=3062643 RepID=UPI0026E3DDAA|nr:FtsX-like permease family protein [Psychrosphaera sp. 1_MG-2023]MDO6721112.1 cell division protein FtsX [Psychrosphaera sp. 1_MG-2023]